MSTEVMSKIKDKGHKFLGPMQSLIFMTSDTRTYFFSRGMF